MRDISRVKYGMRLHRAGETRERKQIVRAFFYVGAEGKDRPRCGRGPIVIGPYEGRRMSGQWRVTSKGKD